MSEITCQNREAFHFDDFELRDGELYYKGKGMPLTIREGKLRSVGVIVEILGKEGIHKVGFGIPKSSTLMARQAIMLSRVEEELPSASDVAKADDIELQEIVKNAARRMEDLITQLDNSLGDSFEHPLCKLLGLEKELRSIRGSLKLEMAKKVQLKEHIERKSVSFPKLETTQNMTMVFEKTSGIRSKS